MIKLLFILSTLFFTVEKSFYDYSLPLVNGRTLNLKNLKGKKVLIVNIATASSHAKQLQSLEALQQRYKGKLVVIAVPSNSFEREPLDNARIAAQLVTKNKASFLIAAKSSVKGKDKLPLFDWLASKEANGVVDIPMVNNFQKVLINGNGKIVGIFFTTEDPLAESIIRTIEEN